MPSDVDLAIIGSGFAGSITAMIARRLGYSVALLERARHPRFAIGESSTPLANLLLEELAERYGLEQVRPFAKWGAWQRAHPEIGCGLKRGFSFFYHPLDAPFAGRADRQDQLLVAASPNDRVADTHWLREDFDHFLVRDAQRLGVDYADRVDLDSMTLSPAGAVLSGRREGLRFTLQAGFVIDATGPRGCLHRALGLHAVASDVLPRTQALFSHFTRVRRLEALPAFRFPTTPPYPIDDAAVHHVFDGGWIWVLRFSNGTTSAGAALTSEAATRLGITPDAAGWTRLLWRLPTVREQFAEAEPLRAFSSLEPLAFRSYEIVGPGWALLPSAAGFVDPLLSTGFPLTLLGVARLGRMLERERADWEAELHAYAQSTTNELLLTERLVAALYATMRDFPLFTQLASLYFGAACFSETARRLGRESMAPGFLLSAHPHFGPAYRACLEFARHPPPHCSPERFRSRLTALVRAALAPIDVAGLTKTERRNWHTVDFKDLYAAAAKLQSSAAEIRAMIHRLEAAT